MNSEFFLTSHSLRHPLLVALAEAGERIARVEDFRSFDAASLRGCKAYFGNLFVEIRHLPAFWNWRRLLRRQGVPYVFWNRDAPWNVGMKPWRALALRYLPPVDIYLAHSRQTAERFAPACHYFPNAALGSYFAGTDLHALRDAAAYPHDVSFMGALGNPAQRGCRDRVEFLSALEAALRRVRPQVRLHWVDTVRERLDIAAQLRLVRESRINLNYGAMCDLPGNRSWGLPERAFGMPAAGGFMLTEYRECIPETFSDDACDSFAGVEDCARKILSYLDDFPRLRQRAEALHRQVAARHTYAARAEELLALLAAYRCR